MAATLTGDAVTSKYYFPLSTNLLGPDTSVVGAGAEVSCPGVSGVCGILLGTYTFDFGSDTIAFDQQIDFNNGYQTTAFNGWVFSGLTFGAGISDVSLTSYGFTGLDSTRLSFTGDTITLNPATVPVPASGALLLAGPGGLALIRHRRI